MDKVTREDVLEYHRGDRPGKLQIQATKPLLTQRDFSLAYSPGVAYAVEALDQDNMRAYEYTAKGNLVAVVSNGSAVLGLGNRGAIPAKPVMEGKALLFKQLADVDVFDIELDARTADEIVAAVKMIAPGFGGINLEDIAAPICFEVEERLKKLLPIPVFHDDQHGTAIISSAALLNALELTQRDITQIRVVVVGAGAAGIACAKMYVTLGAPRQNIVLFDRLGMVFQGRQDDMNERKAWFAVPGPAMSLEGALEGADVLLGVAAADTISPEMIRGMAPNPVLFLLANPDPEIRYELARGTRPDAILATGRSDYPNQVNNVLGFPYVFRGALDVRASAINDEMKMAAARALAGLTREIVPERVLRAYGLERLAIGPDYIIPKPNDYRALEWVALAVAEAAMRSGVARLQLDPDEYRERLRGMERRGWRAVHAVVEKAKRDPKRLVFPEGSHPKVIRASLMLEREGIATPILLGPYETIRRAIADLGLDFEPTIVDPENSPSLTVYAEEIYHLRHRKGVTKELAGIMARNPVVFGLMMVRMGEADCYLCGLMNDYPSVLRPILQLIQAKPDASTVAGVFLVIARNRLYFFSDGLVNIDPEPADLAQIAILTADFVRDFDIEPRVAMVSFSNFGSVRHPEADKVRHATEIVRECRPDIAVDGEMQADTALSPEIADERYPFSTVRDANVLIFANLDAANAAFKVLAQLGEAHVLGPVLLGTNHSVHPVQPSVDVHSLLTLGALAVVEAQEHEARAFRST
jgi:malate dehydrogenase (oxaloacetate-decarboxylating)(NADP+)